MSLQIDEPCHENWENMPAKEQGRFCAQCCKTVFDFTNMPTNEVIQFISERKNERVCGRFRTEQVFVPAAVKVRSNITARVKQFFAALVLVFGGSLFSSCHQPQRMGKVKADNSKEWSETAFAPDTTKKQTKDTLNTKTMGRVQKPEQINGGISAPPPKCVVPTMGKVSTIKPK